MQPILVNNKRTLTDLRITLRRWKSSSHRTRIASLEETIPQHGQPSNINPTAQTPITTELDSAHTCPICLEPTQSILSAPCDHSFCNTCYKTWFTVQQQSCPLCRQGRSSNDTSSRKTSTSSTSSISLNAIYNQALIDNYRIQRTKLPRGTKEQSKVLLAQMHEMERVPNHFASLEQQSKPASTDDVEAYLTERQLAIAALLLSERG